MRTNLIKFFLLLVPIHLSDAVECNPGYGRPEGPIPSGTLNSGTTVRINIGSSSYQGPTFDSTGAVSGRIEVKWPYTEGTLDWGGVSHSVSEHSWGTEEGEIRRGAKEGWAEGLERSDS